MPARRFDYEIAIANEMEIKRTVIVKDVTSEEALIFGRYLATAAAATRTFVRCLSPLSSFPARPPRQF